MKHLVALLGVGQMVYGALLISEAESAMHEIYSGVTFGAGSICFALWALRKPSA